MDRRAPGGVSVEGESQFPPRTPIKGEGEVTVSLNMPTNNTSMGFHLESDYDGEARHLRVGPIDEGTPADGLLREGDIVVSINGTTVKDHESAAVIFRESDGEVIMKVLRKEMDSATETKVEETPLSAPPTLPTLDEAKKSELDRVVGAELSKLNERKAAAAAEVAATVAKERELEVQLAESKAEAKAKEAALEARVARAAELIGTLEAYRSECAALLAEVNADGESTAKKLRDTKGVAARVGAERAEAEARLATARARHKELKERADKAAADGAEAKRKAQQALDVMAAEVVAKESQLKLAKGGCTALEGELLRLQIEQDEEDARLEGKRAMLSSVQGEVAKLDHSLSSEQPGIERLAAREAQLEAGIAAHSEKTPAQIAADARHAAAEKLAALQERYVRELKKMDHGKGEDIEAFAEALADLEGGRATSAETAGTLLAECEEHVRRAAAARADLEAELTQARAERMAGAVAYDAKAMHTDAKKAELAAERDEMTICSQRVALLQHCVATLKTDLSTQSAARDALETALAGAKAEHDKLKQALVKLTREVSAAAEAAASELVSEERVIAGQAEYAAGLAAKFARVDADGDGVISEGEAKAFAEAAVGALPAEGAPAWTHLWRNAAAEAEARVSGAKAREKSLSEELDKLRRSAREAELAIEAERRRAAERRTAQERAVAQLDAYEAGLRKKA